MRHKFIYPKEVYGKEEIQYSVNYILDGHHKLTAYYNLGIPPRLIQIEKIRKQDLRQFEYDTVPLIVDKLLPFQKTHLLSQGFRIDFSTHKKYERLLDDYLLTTLSLHEELLELMDYYAWSDHIYNDIPWVEERIQKLKSRFKDRQSTVHLSFNDSKVDYRQTKAKAKWEDIEKLMPRCRSY